MKNKFLKTIGTAFLAILTVTVFASMQAAAQENAEKQDFGQIQPDYVFRGYARDLEGSWTVAVTVRNCQTGAAVGAFSAMNTFMRGGTMQEFSTGAAPLPRGPGHGVWDHEAGRNFTYAFQFFRFNADGTVAGTTKARRAVTLNQYGNGYSATADIEVYNPAGVLVATACATETATRFE